MKTIKIKTRFMIGNIDIECYVFDVISEKIGKKAAMLLDFDFDNAIYSDGFISAIKRGLTPNLESINSPNLNQEYHHVIINEKCYNVNFTE